MKLSIDRFEGEYAVCAADGGEVYSVNIRCLPDGAREGSIISSGEDGYTLCPDEEEARRKKNFKKAQSLFDE